MLIVMYFYSDKSILLYSNMIQKSRSVNKIKIKFICNMFVMGIQFIYDLNLNGIVYS